MRTVLLQVCVMLVSRAKSGKKQSSDVATFKVHSVMYLWAFVETFICLIV